MMHDRRRPWRITAAPCLFGKRLCGQTFGPSLAKLSDYVFPQPLWKLFGEHLGDDEVEDQEREREREREEGEEEEEASWEPLEALLGSIGPS